MTFTLKQKLRLAFLTLNMLMGLGGAFALYQFSTLHSQVSQTTMSAVHQLELAEQVVEEAQLIRYHGSRFIELGRSDDRTKTLEQLEALRKTVQDKTGPFTFDNTTQPLKANLGALIDSYAKRFENTTTRLDDRTVKQLDVLKDVETIETHLRQLFTYHSERNEVLQPFLFFMTAKMHLSAYFYSFEDQDLLEVSRSLAIVENFLSTPMLFLSKPQENVRQQVADAVKTFMTSLAAFHGDVQQFQREEKEQLTSLPEQMLSQANAIEQSSWTKLRTMMADVERKTSTSQRMILIVLFGSLGLGLTLAFLVARSIITPLAEMAHAARKIAMGDIHQEITHRANDEIGTLASAFQQLIDYIRDVASAADQISRGDLTGAISPRSDHDVLSLSFQRMTANLRAMLGRMQEGAEALTLAIQNIMTLTAQVSANASNSATAVSQMVATAEETKQMAYAVGHRAKDVSINAQQTAHVSQLGQQAVEDAIVGMRRIREHMGSIAQKVIILSERNQTISTIITSVNELAEQSNLLAVNAAIEAAKAGEYGKGFGVVAQEVKHLAVQSKLATERVRVLLRDIQQAVVEAVDVTEQGTHAAEVGVKQSLEAGESIRALSLGITEAAHAMTEIVSSSQQQTVGMDQVVVSISGIKTATLQNTDGIKQIDSETQALYLVGQTLKDCTAQYTMEKRNNVLPAHAERSDVGEGSIRV